MSAFIRPYQAIKHQMLQLAGLEKNVTLPRGPCCHKLFASFDSVPGLVEKDGLLYLAYHLVVFPKSAHFKGSSGLSMMPPDNLE